MPKVQEKPLKSNVLNTDEVLILDTASSSELKRIKVEDIMLNSPVQSVSGKTGVVTLDKSDVGLNNVNNTSDSDKPVSTATQTALNAKINKAGDTMTGKLNLPATTSASLNIASGIAPSSLADNDIYTTANNLFFYKNSVKHALDFDTNTPGTLTKPVITDNGNGTINIASVDCYLYSGTTWNGDFGKFTVPAVTNVAVTDNSVSYLLISYNSGSPIYSVSTSPSSVNGSSVILGAKLFREGTEIHWVPVDWGLSTASRLNDREVSTNRFAWQTGLALSESTGRVINISAGVLWYGASYFSKLAVASAGNQAYFYSHTGGTWVKTSVSTYNNTQYDNGTNLATLSNGRYAVNWVYRLVDGDGLPGIAYVLGGGDYTLAQAQASSSPSLPPLISQMCILVGRIIVAKNAATATQIDSAFSTTFQGTVSANHNDLAGLQGGITNEYYHLTAAQSAMIANSYTTGSVLYYNGANITEDNTSFFYDATNKRLGIGTAMPAQALDVVGSITTSSLFRSNQGLSNNSSSNNALIATLTAGTKISRNVADASSALIVEQANASSTGNVAEFKSDTITGAFITRGGTISARQFATPVQTLTPTGTTQSINWATGGYVNLNLASATGNVTLTLNNAPSGTATVYTIEVIQGATPRNLVFPAGTVQVGGGGVNYTNSGANTIDSIELKWNGSNYRISVSRLLS